MNNISEIKLQIKEDIQELKIQLDIDNLNELNEQEYLQMLDFLEFIKQNFKLTDGKLKINWLKIRTNIKLLGYIAKYLIIIIKSIWSRVNKK